MKIESIFCIIIWIFFTIWQITYINVVSKEMSFLALILYLGIEFILISLSGKKNES